MAVSYYRVVVDVLQYIFSFVGLFHTFVELQMEHSFTNKYCIEFSLLLCSIKLQNWTIGIYKLELNSSDLLQRLAESFW